MNELATDNRPWAVMTHRNPQWIQAMLDKEQRGELQPADDEALGATARYRKEPFDFYIPYLDLLSESGRDLRGDFHRFVFIRASKERLNSIVYADWNRNTRLPLRPYRDRGGNAIMIRERELNRLRMIFRQHHLDFFLGTPVQSLKNAKGRQVRIRLPYWEDKEGEIRRINTKEGQGTASLKVAFLIDGLEKEITFSDLDVNAIEFLDAETQVLLSGKVIENFEREVAVLLGHRFVHRRFRKDADRKAYQAERRREDMPRLRHLLSFADIEMDNDDDHRRFTALMLMCSVMAGDADATRRYQSQIENWLGDKTALASTATDAYLMTALFVATRAPYLRTAVKAFRNAHPDCPPIISRFINKVRDLRTRVKGSDPLTR